MAVRVVGRHRPGRANADEALASLYAAHFRALVRLAALLAGDTDVAEEIAGSAFADMYRAWTSLRLDEQSLLAFLRRRVVARARSSRRGRHLPPSMTPPGAAVSSAGGPGSATTAATLLASIYLLPGRELEALVLACYAGMTVTEIGSVTGTTASAATRSIQRGLAALAQGASIPGPADDQSS
ncbi:MAG TPA: hypothetical protein VGI58_16600 [Streptosporangiaceae bacterium]